MELLMLSLIFGYWKTLTVMVIFGYCLTYTSITHFRMFVGKMQELMIQYRAA